MSKDSPVMIEEDDDICIISSRIAESFCIIDDPISYRNYSGSNSDLLNETPHTNDESIVNPCANIARNTELNTSKKLRNDDLCPPYAEISTHKYNSILLQAGTTVQLKADPKIPHEDIFLRVCIVFKNLQTDQVYLRGYKLQRTRDFGGWMRSKLNETCMVLKVDYDDPRSPFIQGMEDISLDQIKSERLLRLTTKDFPRFSFRETLPPGISINENKEYIANNGNLVCRWVHMMGFENSFEREKGRKSVSGELRRLLKIETDSRVNMFIGPGKFQPEKSNRRKSMNPSHEIAIDLISEDETPCSSRTSVDSMTLPSHSPRRRSVSGDVNFTNGRDLHRSPSLELLDYPPRALFPRRGEMARRQEQVTSPLVAQWIEGSGSFKREKYTFGDIFCGGGGASEGAKQAGLNVAYGVDIDSDVEETYSENHPEADFHPMDATDFPPQNLAARVNILHISSCCQTYSPAYTTPGPNHDRNYNTLFVVGRIIRDIKPDIVTLEQTFGLYTHHPMEFNRLIEMIVTEDYNLRFALLDTRRLGLAQTRKRLFIIGARIGIPLPDFPPYTHGSPGSGLKPFTGMYDACKDIQPWATHHDISDSTRRDRDPYDPYTALAPTITTGGSILHWSGKRDCTPREWARLQSFPDEYNFIGTKTKVRRQIGNAVPPMIQRKILESCIKALDEFYGRRRETIIIND